MTLGHFSKDLIRPVSGGQFSKQKRSAPLNYKQDEDGDGEMRKQKGEKINGER